MSANNAARLPRSFSARKPFNKMFNCRVYGERKKEEREKGGREKTREREGREKERERERESRRE